MQSETARIVFLICEYLWKSIVVSRREIKLDLCILSISRILQILLLKSIRRRESLQFLLKDISI